MSQSLPKGDWEITPVQAWFLLMGRLGVNPLMEEGVKRKTGLNEGFLAKLKSGLANLVSCFEFGAVMDEATFWEVVEEVLKGEEAQVVV